LSEKGSNYTSAILGFLMLMPSEGYHNEQHDYARSNHNSDKPTNLLKFVNQKRCRSEQEQANKPEQV